MVPGIAIATTGGSPGLAIAGSFLTFGSMAVFLFTVVRHGFGASRPQTWTDASSGRMTPAE
jgi:hypothetical protein